MAEGWIKLWRQSIDSRVFSDAELWKLWTWCLMRANHADRYFEGELVPRGSFVSGSRSAAEVLGSSSSTVHRQWKRLADWGMIVLNVKRTFTIITICQYETYQGDESDDETQVERERDTTETPVKHGRNTTETPVKPREELQELQALKNGKNNPQTPNDEFQLSSKPKPSPKDKPLAPTLPPSIRTPAMVEAVEAWIAYKTERREGYKPQGLKALYARIANVAAQHGPQVVIDRMQRAMASNWQGWDFAEPPKNGANRDDPRGTFATAENYLNS
jgi:hypothetical protein